MNAVLSRNIDIDCTDVDGIEFNVTYSDNKKIRKEYFATGDEFAVLFKTIKSIVTDLEFVLSVLFTEEDYKEE